MLTSPQVDILLDIARSTNEALHRCNADVQSLTNQYKFLNLKLDTAIAEIKEVSHALWNFQNTFFGGYSKDESVSAE